MLGAGAALAVAVARSLEDDAPRRIEIRARMPEREPFYFEPKTKSKPHVDDCWCQECTERLLAAHRAYLKAWIEQDQKRSSDKRGMG